VVKRIALMLLCLAVALMLAGCATIDSQNSFQNEAPKEVAATQTGEPAETEASQPVQPTETAIPAATPTPTTGEGGING